MRIRISDLWTWEGKIDRGRYALIGFVGFALKYNLDRLLARIAFHRSWGMLDYWIPAGTAIHITSLPATEAKFLAWMVALALPFIWVGVVLTLRRLRDVGLPVGLLVLFFVPVVNLAFFAILCILPSRESSTSDIPGAFRARQTLLGRIIPRTALGSAAVAVVVTAAFGLLLVWLGASLMNAYGWGLFIALPFSLGLLSALVYGYHQPRNFGQCVLVGLLSIGFLAAGLLTAAIEGAICIAMAAPLAILLVFMGSAVGYCIQRRIWPNPPAPAIASLLLIFLPGVMSVERVTSPAPPVFAVQTAIEINAPPEAVWNQVVAFSEIPPPRELLFRAGIAYPIRAEILGRGPGAERHCVFSTGAFVEPIQVWDEPHLLKFSVSENPPPMAEWTPYHRIDAPHLHGYLVSNGGQFLLTPLPGGRTRLEGTTWYRHSLWPAGYWRLWSDAIIHRIHLRVLLHIQALAEHNVGEAATLSSQPSR
ncbi:MAG: DUF805 domain-containing protein [Candidatus Acidiferrales bacterium]